MKDLDGRFDMPESAFLSARDSHGANNPTVRSGMYVPTRREVSEKSPEWLYHVLVDWLWECPTELIPNNVQIEEVKGLLVERVDAGDPTIVKLIIECNDFLSY